MSKARKDKPIEKYMPDKSAPPGRSGWGYVASQQKIKKKIAAKYDGGAGFDSYKILDQMETGDTTPEV